MIPQLTSARNRLTNPIFAKDPQNLFKIDLVS
jgi:hypothetical protein